MNLTDSVTSIPYVGSQYAPLLAKLEIKTLGDLLEHYPTRYENYSLRSTIGRVQPGEIVTIVGRISSFQHKFTRKRGFTIQEATLRDESGTLLLRWFNQPFLQHALKVNDRCAIAGAVEQERSQLLMQNPEYEIIKNDTDELIHTGRLVPIYSETKGISSKWIRSKVALLLGIHNWYNRAYSVVDQIDDWLPQEILNREDFIDRKKAIQHIHFPPSDAQCAQARNRLAFDELLQLQLESQWRKKEWQTRGKAQIVKRKTEEMEKFLEKLPFELTNDQKKAIEDILKDMEKSVPMNRLLQGDVGAGKTVVAAAAAVVAINAGYQVALMAPTQVLADQHTQTLTDLLKPLGVSIVSLTGASKTPASEHSENSDRQKVRPSENLILRKSDSPSVPSFPDLIIGTHALLHKRASELIDTKRLALVIIDEQHRFGVSQRATLIKRGAHPHVLSMTATPIPRTIALSLYANLDMSVISEMPVGRLLVKTWVVPEEKRARAYQWIGDRIKKFHEQAFIVCPLIEQSEHESMAAIRAATKEFADLKQRFKTLKLDLLHGQIKPKEKTTILNRMKAHENDILVATPVVEVGVDVPDATVMVIEGAERFGLAQLHQLRGRVGRRDKQSYCLLFTSDNSHSGRLKALETTNNGLKLAELDLAQRGPGSLGGTLQHGWPQLKLADFADISRIKQAQFVASELMNNLDKYPQIANRLNALAKLVAAN